VEGHGASLTGAGDANVHRLVHRMPA
jgi:hypothetical protein